MTDNYITRGCIKKKVVNTGDGAFQCICPGCNKMNVFDWLETIPDSEIVGNIVEVRFKNTRKGYFQNAPETPLKIGDVVAVEASPGHDMGVVSLTGELVPLQMKRNNVSAVNLKKIYRKAKQNDVEKWFQAIEKEPETIRLARQIVTNLNLEMKISDVEFQGDKTKATFYYTSDERVDFRQLIKEFADNFKVRIEMKQIGARQEAGKVGGIGTCGREICCASWLSSFMSVSTGAARYQEMSLNPQKLAGQCGKLKCCLNYELKCYLDAISDFPDFSIPLKTEKGMAYHRKTDVYRRLVWYSFEKESESAELIPMDVDIVKEIIHLNNQGNVLKELEASDGYTEKKSLINYQNAVGEDSINRFEEKKRRNKKKNGRGQIQQKTTENRPPRRDKNRRNQNNKHENRDKGNIEKSESKTEN